MADRSKHPADTTQRRRRSKSTKSQSNHKSDTNASTTIGPDPNPNSTQAKAKNKKQNKGNGKAKDEVRIPDPRGWERGRRQTRTEAWIAMKMEESVRTPLPVVEAHVAIGASKSDICFFAHFMIGFLRHLKTEWVQILLEIDGVGEELTFDYILLSDDPYIKTESWKTTYLTWNQLQCIRIQVHALPHLVTDQVLLRHCNLLLQRFREKGIKATSRWIWHPSEQAILERFLESKIEFFVGEGGQEVLWDGNDGTGDGDSSPESGLSLQPPLINQALAGVDLGDTTSTDSDAKIRQIVFAPEGSLDKGSSKQDFEAVELADNVALAEDGPAITKNMASQQAAFEQDPTIMRDKPALDIDKAWHNGSDVKHVALAEKDEAIDKATAARRGPSLDEDPITPHVTFAKKDEMMENGLGIEASRLRDGAIVVEDVPTKDSIHLVNGGSSKETVLEEKGAQIGRGIKKLEVIWEETPILSGIMKALNIIAMVEIDGFCGCFDRCALNRTIDPEIESEVAFPVRERMKIKSRNFQSDNSPDRFLLRERQVLGSRRS